MEIKHILFDLDGTLLPMKQDEFVEYYLPILAKRFVGRGVDAKAFIGYIWKGFAAMVANDGRCTNEEVFWKCFLEKMPISHEEMVKDTIDFYSGDFNQAIASTQPSPVSGEIIRTAKEKGIQVYLATNPVFPRVATVSRIHWAGLDPEDFRIITTYENCSYCKPNVKYYEMILKQFDLNPEECLMVGNDAEDDLAIGKLGVKTFLVTDCLENKKNLPLTADYTGSLGDCLAFVRTL
ncbi:MAG: HAD family hydrolase [Lachnoclostridium sp.]